MPIITKLYNSVYSFRKNFFSSFLEVFSFVHVRIYLFFVIGLNIVLWIFSYFIKSNISQDLIILHYNVDFGVDLIGEVGRLYIIPSLSALVLFFNLVLLLYFAKYEHFRFISHLLMIACLLINIILLLSLASIYLINFR